MRVVYPKASVVLTMPEGNSLHVPLGTHWAADDPVVLAHPEMFSEDPRHGVYRHTPESLVDDVEQATAAPGERRSVRRG
jgi:hypothetical protein